MPVVAECCRHWRLTFRAFQQFDLRATREVHVGKSSSTSTRSDSSETRIVVACAASRLRAVPPECAHVREVWPVRPPRVRPLGHLTYAHRGGPGLAQGLPHCSFLSERVGPGAIELLGG